MGDAEDLAHLRRPRDLMDREYARPLDVLALARAAPMSSSHFARQFRFAYGESPYNDVMTRRIERAKALPRRGEQSESAVVPASWPKSGPDRAGSEKPVGSIRIA